MSHGTPPKKIFVEYEEFGPAMELLGGSWPDQVHVASQTLAAERYSLAALSKAKGSVLGPELVGNGRDSEVKVLVGSLKEQWF